MTTKNSHTFLNNKFEEFDKIYNTLNDFTKKILDIELEIVKEYDNELKNEENKLNEFNLLKNEIQQKLNKHRSVEEMHSLTNNGDFKYYSTTEHKEAEDKLIGELLSKLKNHAQFTILPKLNKLLLLLIRYKSDINDNVDKLKNIQYLIKGRINTLKRNLEKTNYTKNKVLNNNVNKGDKYIQINIDEKLKETLEKTLDFLDKTYNYGLKVRSYYSLGTYVTNTSSNAKKST